MSVVDVRNLSFRYTEAPVLGDVSFCVSEGQLTGLLGPNGSGKTTLFRILATLLPLQEGQITVCGVALRDNPSQIRHHLGITFQAPALDIRLTVQENLNCHGHLYGMSASQIASRSEELLACLSLLDRRHVRVEQLSGGLKRRAELAKGLLHRPSVLLLDEPSTGLDPAARRQFWNLIQDQRRREGTTVIVTTHLMDEAESCDDLILLDQGRIVRHGSPAELQSLVTTQRLTIRLRNSESVRGRLETRIGSTGTVHGDRILFHLSNAGEALNLVMNEFSAEVVSAEVAQPSLEDVFLTLTGHSLMDDSAS
ncbi:MAG: ABC transporter ATP-binding protein [Planctomycetaceae bacterium]|nr:ABC transporter ATP-binding protein [Planctomycetaceae bacterium]